jgi:hypothetical protein
MLPGVYTAYTWALYCFGKHNMTFIVTDAHTNFDFVPVIRKRNINVTFYTFPFQVSTNVIKAATAYVSA